MDTICYDKFNFHLPNLNKSITNHSNTGHGFKLPKSHAHIQDILFPLSIAVILLLYSASKFLTKINQAAIINRISALGHCVIIKAISILCIVISFVTSPIIFAVLLIFNYYRIIVHLLLKLKYGNRFAGLLEGTDAIWAIEDVSKCVINILMVIESKEIFKLHVKLEQTMSKIIHDKRFEKLGYQREKSYGYYYWKKCNIQTESNIKYMKILEGLENGLNTKNLQGLLSKYNNTPLPNNHASSWEILIGTQVLLTEEGSLTNTYPVLFRFHHSVGDGIALLRILLEVVDNKTENINHFPKFIDMENLENISILQIIINAIKSYLMVLLAIIFIPGHLLYLNMIRTVDKNIIHGPELTGEKVVVWLLEKNDFQALRAIKQIKSKFSESTFNDVLLAALSNSLYKYFSQYTNNIPPSITVVLPERREAIYSSQFLAKDVMREMQNRFSIGMLYLPLLPQRKYDGEYNMLDRLQDVRRQTTLLKNASDYKINYWLLRVVAKLLPEYFLRAMIQSTHSTMIMSNIIGPEKLTICDGFNVNDIAFWIPHRGLTGIGFSAISYGNRLELALSADRALISNVEDAQMILEDIFKSLNQLLESLF